MVPSLSIPIGRFCFSDGSLDRFVIPLRSIPREDEFLQSKNSLFSRTVSEAIQTDIVSASIERSQSPVSARLSAMIEQPNYSSPGAEASGLGRFVSELSACWFQRLCAEAELLKVSG